MSRERLYFYDAGCYCYSALHRITEHTIKINKTSAEAFTLPAKREVNLQQTGHLCTTAQAGTDPGFFVCRSKFTGLKVGRES